MRVLGSTVLALEAIVLLLAIPVGLVLGTGLSTGVTVAVFGGLAVLCLVVIGMVTRPQGAAAGWVVQGLVIASGLLVPAMALLGSLFALLWYAAVRMGRASDAAREEARAASSGGGPGEGAVEAGPGEPAPGR